MNLTQLCRNLVPAGSVMSRPTAIFMIFLLLLSFVPVSAFAQTTATWRVQVWEQDDGGPYDQFAAFCETGSPCTGVTGVQICVDGLVNCQSTSGNPSTAVFTGLSLAPHTACLVDPNWLVVSGSSGAPLDSPGSNCVTRDFTGNAANPDQSTAMYVEENIFEVTVTKAFTEAHPVADSEVEITLTCDAGTVSTTDPNEIIEIDNPEGPPPSPSASKPTEGGSATFWVTGTANCWATEVVPPGYVQTDSDCGDEVEPGIVLPSDEPIGCTITNRPTEATFTVDKQFSDGNTSLNADVVVSCTDDDDGPGIVTDPDPAEGTASEGTNFVVTAKWLGSNASCTATETDLVGYTQITDPGGDDCSTEQAVDDDTDNSCVIFNDQDPVFINADKIYSNGGGASADFAVECTNLDDGGTVTPPTASASPGNPAIFEVNDFMWDGSTICNVTEPVAPGGTWETDNTCVDLSIVPSDDPVECAITNSPTRATFRVTKVFDDGNNVDEIEVSIDCNTGLILDQDKDLSHNEWVEFVVTDFTDGLLECTITEDGQAGYTGEYDNVSLGNIISDENCAYPAESISAETPAHECLITNYPDPVTVSVYKDWVFQGTTEPDIDTYIEIIMWCDSEIISVDCPIYGPASETPFETPAADIGYWYSYCEGPTGLNDVGFVSQVIPRFPATNCTIVEYVYDQAIEQDNGCGSFQVSVNNGYDCVITNTVFFEGIPTLSQYGMALLALLMLGVGFVSFRRFS